MNNYLQSAFSGWAAVLLFGTGVAMPFLLHNSLRSSKPFLRRMWPHYWLGYLTFFASFAHSWMAMSSGDMKGVDVPGVWIATLALLVILWQVAIGLLLRDPSQSSRRALRRAHFWTMMLVAVLIFVHVSRNRP
jgi:hypothetical protein